MIVATCVEGAVGPDGGGCEDGAPGLILPFQAAVRIQGIEAVIIAANIEGAVGPDGWRGKSSGTIRVISVVILVIGIVFLILVAPFQIAVGIQGKERGESGKDCTHIDGAVFGNRGWEKGVSVIVIGIATAINTLG